MSRSPYCLQWTSQPMGATSPDLTRPCTCPIRCRACGYSPPVRAVRRECFCIGSADEYERACADQRWVDAQIFAEAEQPVYDEAAASDRDYERWHARESERAQELVDFSSRGRW